MELVQRIPDQLFENSKSDPNRRAFHFPVGKTGQWRDMTWGEYHRRVCKLAGWLIEQGISHGDRVAIVSANRPEWFIADMAIMAAGAVSVPIYPTLTEKEVRFIIEHSESKIALVDDSDRSKTVANANLSKVVIFDGPAPDAPANQLSLDAVLASGAKPIDRPPTLNDEDLATIVYTSGTTGVPKGAVHTHGNFRHAMTSVVEIIGKPTNGSIDRFFSFLPLSHVAERVLVLMGSLYTASEVAFARSIKTVGEDLVHCRPTILLCVPRLWEKIYEKIMAGLQTAPIVKRTVFALARNLGACRLDGNRIIPARSTFLRARISDRLVGGKLRQKLGMDRCRLVVTGSAPTRPDVMAFFASFGLCIREVYGLTENLCLGVLHSDQLMIIGNCGKNFPGGQVRIAADGEIQFKANWIFKGYYKNDPATKEAFSDDGWFATGDLGQLDSQGFLSIVGRKKELLKTSGGKYVAPVPIEDRLKAELLISDAMVVGDNRKFCVALVALDPEVMGSTPATEKKDELLATLDRVNDGLASFESIKRLGIMRKGFSEEDGTLTPSMKLKRNVAMQKYAAFIERLYEASEAIIFE